ncbi:hypothetical protein BASA81_001863 [Batrachochytrium salamandrivorans]|nr:hypothetical protein BASA81_001863 [Batrachochytrium salamandrivorans]
MLVAWVLTCLLLAREGAGFTVPAVDYASQLAEPELQYLRFNLEQFGIISFTNIPGFAEARADALAGLGECYRKNGISPVASLRVELPDGTVRTTLAPGASGVDGCPGLQQKLDELQRVVSVASRVFARALDEAALAHSPLLMAVDNAERASYLDFAQLVEHGQHLDHFHVYEKKQPPQKQAALEKHSDQGLFVAIAPAITLGGGEDGFEIELPSGEMARVDFPHDGNALVFMIGDGMANWIAPSALRRPLRSLAHRLVMPHDQQRVWFGRMFFPPPDAFLPNLRTTFSKYRQLSVEQASNVDFVGCSNQKHVLRDLTELACGADEIYCWMACQSTENVHCQSGSSTIECVDPADGHIWTDADGHCVSCSPQCYGEPAPAANTQGVCNPRIAPTNMFMSGFNGIGPNLNCVVFLFQSWVMDTEVKYAFGSLGAFLVAFTVEAVVALRRQLVLAYFAMLLAMSFATVIFIMIMLGFVCGHALFNYELPAGGNEACCNVNQPLLATTTVPPSQPLLPKPLEQTCCREVVEGDSVDTA